ncbi:MAG: amino acid permease [Anaerocolumna sp.]|jgi:APA family basic amino acid/polyamine antiporter|nr:amino acid permease [Anaerocolumna sp.]
MKTHKYGLFTSIAMITGIVIGSGIFFKSDNILKSTNGNLGDGILVFILAAFAIVFGSLAISQLAMKTDKPGGIITYAEEFCSMPIGCAFGWFQSFAYLPSIAAVVAWVAGIYTCILFNLPNTLENQVLLGLGYILILSLFNTLSARLGGYIQNGTMIIKLIPLIIIAIAGIAFGDPGKSMNYNTVSIGGAGLLSAILPIAFSFDGWSISTSICHEIKNSKRNLPLALIISPILILVIYVLYFVGITSLVGAENVISMGDDHVNFAATKLFGEMGGKLIIVFVIISVLGTVNGLILGSIRLPYAMALRNMIPGSEVIKKTNTKLNGMPLNSAILATAFTLLWLLLHYVTQKFNLLPNSDVSEISIVTNYLGYIILYIAVIRLTRKGEIKGKFKGYIIPVLAIFGALIILLGGIKNPLFPMFLVFCVTLVVISIIYAQKNKHRIL